jgi:hypothetical protein
MTIKITRAFERTRQIADFVPIKAYCEATAEFDDVEMTAEQIERRIRTNSLFLDNIVQSEVDNTLKSYYPMCIVCGGKGQKLSLNKEGVCGQCVSTAQFQARDLKKETGTPKPKQQ